MRTKREYLYNRIMVSASSLHSNAATPAPCGLQLLAAATDMSLPYGRLHEACGTARQRFGLWLAARTKGPVLWITPEWNTDRLHACGVADIVNPARLIFVTPRRPEDILWSMEEAMRSGAVDLAIADVPGLPGLTQVRRIHLAAETGGQNRTHAPLGLLLTPGEGGAQGVETRWALTAQHAAPLQSWRLDRLRARRAPQKSWTITQGPKQATPTSIQAA
ncbi:hypothetical protein [Ascidiaceihabitans sp.]|uniref:ImuA family protein n=1 Tax=Ascidiaceihabitans sp. TaxID=1872644 RepID=UPI0032987872